MKLADYIVKATEAAPGQPSTVRALAFFGVFFIVFLASAMWAIFCFVEGKLIEIPGSVTAFFGSLVGGLLTAKVAQRFSEDNEPSIKSNDKPAE